MLPEQARRSRGIEQRRASNAAHSKLVNEILLALGSLPDVRLFKRVTGGAKLASGQWARFGVQGQADLWGFIRGGRAVEIEVKTGGAVPKPAQKAWKETCERFGVLHVVAHSVEEAELAVRAALNGGARG